MCSDYRCVHKNIMTPSQYAFKVAAVSPGLFVCLPGFFKVRNVTM